MASLTPELIINQHGSWMWRNPTALSAHHCEFFSRNQPFSIRGASATSRPTNGTKWFVLKLAWIIYICVYIYVCRWYMHACMHACMYVCMDGCMHACMYVRTYVCMYICIYAYMYICIYIYTSFKSQWRYQWIIIILLYIAIKYECPMAYHHDPMILFKLALHWVSIHGNTNSSITHHL